MEGSSKPGTQHMESSSRQISAWRAGLVAGLTQWWGLPHLRLQEQPQPSLLALGCVCSAPWDEVGEVGSEPPAGVTALSRSAVVTLGSGLLPCPCRGMEKGPTNPNTTPWVSQCRRGRVPQRECSEADGTAAQKPIPKCSVLCCTACLESGQQI